jgi:SAM-dependent methyltransferase
VTDRRFTGERLHEGDALFAVDLARHQAAYAFARGRVRAGRVLDLGSGSGHGAAQLGAAGARVVGVDRVAPDASSRNASALFVRADLRGLPFPDASFDLIVSFQVIEHLEDPAEYLEAIARLSKRDGLAILTTPNLLMSDRVNPYHVHEYASGASCGSIRCVCASGCPRRWCSTSSRCSPCSCGAAAAKPRRRSAGATFRSAPPATTASICWRCAGAPGDAA